MMFRSILEQLRQGKERNQELQRRGINFARRADVILAVIVVLVAVAAVAGGAFLGAVEQAQGNFDPPVAEPIRDERILTNIRHHTEPFVDATVVPGEDALYAIRRSGTVHRLKLSTMLWSGEEELRKLTPDLTTNVALLQSGCGHQHAEASALCKSDKTLFAVTEGGGVAMRRSGRWTVLLGDTQFRGRDGRPVKVEELRSAVVTSEKDLLLIGTETQGIGIFDLVRRTWTRLPADVDARLAAQDSTGAKPRAITHLVADDGRILVGTNSGLFQLSQESDTWRLSPVANVAGRVIDIVTTRRAPFVLSGESCTNATADECIALRRIPTAGPAQLVIGEIERLATLNDASIFHIASSGTEIVAYGAQGIFAYIVPERRWVQREVRPVTQIWQAASGGRLVYSHADEIVTVEDSGQSIKHAFPGVRQIVAGAGPSGMPLVLTEANQVFQLSEAGAPRQLLDDSTGRYPLAEYETAVDIAEMVLFFGPNGALLHDPRRRTYRIIEKSALPPALLAPRPVLRATGNVLWLIQTSSLSAFILDADASNLSLSEIAPATFAGPLRSLGPGGKSQTLLAVDANNIPFEASIERRGQAATVKLSAILGSQPKASPGTFVDAVVDPTSAILAANQGGRDGLWRYDLSRRAWAGPFATELGQEHLNGIALAGTQLFALGSQGSVVPSSAGVERGSGAPPSAARILGADTLLPFDSKDLVDAMAAPPLLALTGRTSSGVGSVVIYDTSARRIVRTYQLSTTTPRIAGFINSLPVVYDANPAVARRSGAWLGPEALTVDGAPAISASVRDGLILTTHRDGAGRIFLAERAAEGGVVCLFRQPDLLAKEVLDVRDMSGRLALLTDRGLRLYSPADRRFSAESDTTAAGTRLAVFKDHLVTYDDGNARIIPLSGQGALTAPGSCEAKPLSFSVQRITARQVAVDEGQSRIATLRANGEIGHWSGSQTAVLPATTEGPESAGLRRLVQNGSEVHFASLTSVSTYHLVSRQWRSTRIAMPAPGAIDVGLTLVGQRLAVTATDKDGQQYLGFMSAGPDITMAQIAQKEIGAAPFDPSALIDVLELQPHLWAFLSDRELSILDVRQRQWLQTISFDRPSPQRRLEDWNTHWAVRDGPSATARIAFIPRQKLLEPAVGPKVNTPAPPQALSSIGFIHEPLPGEKFALAEGAARNGDRVFELLRLLANDELVACPLTKPGPVSSTCEQKLRPALQIAPDTALAAFFWQDQVAYYVDPGIFRGNRLILADRRARLSRDLTDDIAKLNFSIDPKTVIGDIVDNELWLRNAVGRAIAIAKGSEPRLLLEDSEEVFAARGRIWAMTRAGLRLYRDRAFLTPTATVDAVFKGGGVAFPSIDREGLVVGLRADKTIAFEAGSPGIAMIQGPATDNLLQAWDNWKRLGFTDPRPVQRGVMTVDGSPRDGWWIADANKLQFVARVPCVLPDVLGRIDSGCVRNVISYNLPTGRWSVSEIGDQSPPTIKLTSGGLESTFRGTAAGGDLERVGDTASRRRVGDPAPNNLDGFRRAITGNILDRVELRQNPESSIVAAYGSFLVLARGILSGSDARPLNRPWLRWSRTPQGGRSTFQVRGPDDRPLDLPATELFPNAVFAPSIPGRALPAGDNEIVIGNALGLWRWPMPGDLVDRGPAWQRFDRRLPEIVAATSGRFYFDRGSLASDRRAIEPDSGEINVRQQDLRLTETVRGGASNIVATLTIGGRPVNDFGVRGFLHDQRQSIAFGAPGVMVLTPVGVVSATSYEGILPAPFAGASAPQLFAHDRDLYAMEKPGAAEALKWTRTGWTAGRDPRLNGVLYKDTGWTWSRASGNVVLEGADWRTARRSWSFIADTVIGATYADRETVMMSEDGTRSAARFAELAQGQPATVANPPGPGDRVLETRFAGPRRPVAGIVDNGGMGQIWANPRGWSGVTSGVNPDLQRSAVDSSFLGITFSQAAATIELQAEHPTAGRTRIPISWQQRQPFPFDYAVAIGGDSGRLFIATSAALQIMDVANSRLRIVDTRPSAQGQPTPLGRIGRPVNAPQKLLAQGAGSTSDCLDLSGPSPAFCTDINPLAERMLGSTSFWSWTFRDAPAMRYLDRNGATAGREIRSLSVDGFPHDRPSALQTCNGQAFMLWSGGAFATELETATLGIGGRTATEVLPVRMDRLHCQTQPASIGPAGARLPAALYALQTPNSGASSLQFDGGRWVAISRDLAREAALRADDRYPFERPRLRLRRNAPQAGLTLEYLGVSDSWKPLKVNGRRYAIDERAKLLVAGGEAWSVTDDGLVRFSWTGDLLAIDPGNLQIATLPPVRGKPCSVDRIEPADGTGIALAAIQSSQNPKPIMMRCTDGAVFSTSAIGAADDGGFALLPTGTDPFSRRSVLTTQDGALRWNIERPVNSVGRLSAEWRNEPTPLSAGRFQADALRSVAAFEDGTLDVVSEQGWARTPERAPTLANSARPPGRDAEAKNVRAVARDVDDSGKAFLCLSTTTSPRSGGASSSSVQAAYRADGGFETGIDCGRHDAHEGAWRYRARLQATPPQAGTTRLSIRGFDANKAAFDRPFIDGRFGDMVAIAGPIVSAEDGAGRILIPTTAGTTTFGSRGQLIDAPVHRHAGAKLWMLTAAADGTIRVVTTNRIESLDGQPASGCQATPKMLEALAGVVRDAQSVDAKFLSASATPEGRLELTVQARGERFMLEQACVGETSPGMWRTITSVAGRPRLSAMIDRWPGPPEINFNWRNDRLTALRAGTPETGATSLLSNTKRPLRLFHTGSSVVLLTDREIYRVDLDGTLSTLVQ